MMGFRSESKLLKSTTGLHIEDLGRSGRHIEICYSLKSVESSSDVALPWSIRQCTVWHSMDLITGQSTWIVVKANDVISQAMQQRSEKMQTSKRMCPAKRSSALVDCIEMHKTVCNWVSDNWHWYINDLETYLQEKTRQAISFSAEPLPKTSTTAWPGPAPSCATGSMPNPQPFSPKRSWSLRTLVRDRTMSGSTYAESSGVIPPSTISSVPNPQEPTGFGDFSFRDLQSVQFVEERSNEALLILKTDVSVLGDLTEEYRRLAAVIRDDPALAFDDLDATIQAFERQASRIEKDLKMQMSRLRTLLSVTADRKSLVSQASV